MTFLSEFDEPRDILATLLRAGGQFWRILTVRAAGQPFVFRNCRVFTAAVFLKQMFFETIRNTPATIGCGLASHPICRHRSTAAAEEE
jgi:hypothetical protein